jgi:hypothetical protein
MPSFSRYTYLSLFARRIAETVLAYIASLQSKVQDLGGSLDEPMAEADGDIFVVPAYDSASSGAKEDYDTASDCKQQAADAKSAGEWEKALDLYNQAVLAAPPSALLYANRALTLVQLIL